MSRKEKTLEKERWMYDFIFIENLLSYYFLLKAMNPGKWTIEKHNRPKVPKHNYHQN